MPVRRRFFRRRGGYARWSTRSMLKQVYKDDMTRGQAVQLALKVPSKIMDSTSLYAEKQELAEISLSPQSVFQHQVCSPENLNKLLVKHDITQAVEE